MGQVDMMTLARFMILLPSFLAATHLAERILDTNTGERYHYVILSLLLVTGIAAVIF
jgi:hypothetical protein